MQKCRMNLKGPAPPTIYVWHRMMIYDFAATMCMQTVRALFVH